MLWLLGWLIYGLVVGLCAKSLHPGDDPVGFLPTIGIGVAGSYIGGLVNWLAGRGGPFEASGIILSILGGVAFCWMYRKYKLDRFLSAQSKGVRPFKKKDK